MIPDRMFKFVIWDLEGGDRTHDRGADDPGRLTKFGLSQTANPDLDIANLTEAQARDIYYARYWAPARCGDLPPAISLMHFDCAVNQGVGTAARLLQHAANVRPDGVIGEATIAAVHAFDPYKLLRRYAKERKDKWLSLDNRVEEANENGWINRLIDVIFESLTYI